MYRYPLNPEVLVGNKKRDSRRSFRSMNILEGVTVPQESV